MNDENDKKEPDVTVRPLSEGQPTAAGEHISVTEPLMETEMTEEVLRLLSVRKMVGHRPDPQAGERKRKRKRNRKKKRREKKKRKK